MNTSKTMRARCASRRVAKQASSLAHFDARRALLDAYGERAREGVPRQQRPIHNDYNVHNYLFRDDAPRIILDWEASVGAPREYEVVRCLDRPLVRPNAARRFLNGYMSQRPLERAKIRWAIDATLTMHALKHWPVRAWIDGKPKAQISCMAACRL